MHKLLLLIASHFICDTVFQPEHVSKYKNPYVLKPEGFNQTTWPYIMAGHAFIHAMAVYLITGSTDFFLAEFFFHCGIDLAKCKGVFGKNYNMHIDQGLHLLCKAFYMVAL